MKTAVLILALFSMSAQASTVYVQSNQADRNSLLSFELSATGQLTAKSVTDTSGKGIVDSSFALGPFDSDQEIIVNAAKTLLFSVNSGSNSIAVFHIQKDGTLKPVQGSPFDSHGSNPVSLGLNGNLLTVVNKHEDPAQSSDGSLPNYTNFRVSREGTLRWIANSTVEVANGSSPSQALISPLGPFVFGADFLGGLIQTFENSRHGILQQRSSSGIPLNQFPDKQTPRFPLGLAAHPKHAIVYVGLPTANKIAVYTYDNYGRIKFQRTIDDSGTVVCWMVINRSGTRMYASNTGDSSVTVYDLSIDPENPRELQKIGLPSQGGAYQLALSPDEKNLLVLTQRFQESIPAGQGNEIHILALDKKSGTASIVSGSPFKLDLPGDTRPQGIVIF